MLPSFEDFGLDDGRGVMPSYQPSKKPSQESDGFKEKEKKGTGKTSSSGTKGTGTKGIGAEKGKTEEDKKRAEEAQKKKPTEAPVPQIKHAEVKKNVEDLLRKDIEEASNIILETPEFQSNQSLKQYLLPTA
jgi:hypothetical protein